MHISTSTVSCGIGELCDFDFKKPSKRSFVRTLKDTFYYRDHPYNILLANVIDAQKGVKKPLLALGFKRLRRFKNNNSGNWNTLYILDLDEWLKKEKIKL